MLEYATATFNGIPRETRVYLGGSAAVILDFKLAIEKFIKETEAAIESAKDIRNKAIYEAVGIPVSLFEGQNQYRQAQIATGRLVLKGIEDGSIGRQELILAAKKRRGGPLAEHDPLAELIGMMDYPTSLLETI